MTTKIKIIFGFSIMIVLLVGLASIGFIGLETASGGFTQYRRLARLNVHVSEMATSMNSALVSVYRFTTTDDNAHLGDAKKSLADLSKLVEQTREFVVEAKNIAILQEIDADIKVFATAIDRIDENTTLVLTQYRDIVLPGGHEVARQLKALDELALRFGNTRVSSLIMDAMGQLGTQRSAASRFAQSRLDKDGQRVLEVVSELKKSFDEIGRHLETAEGKKQYEAIVASLSGMETAVKDMVVQCREFANSLKQIDAIGNGTSVKLTNFEQEVKQEMDAQGPRTLTGNENAQQMTLFVSAVGLLLGIAISIFIILGLVRVLREVVLFAEAIAKGDFDYQVSTREKGEIGTLVASMKHIPETLENVLGEYQRLGTDVEYGALETRGDEAKFQGGFATLIKGTNDILDRFLTVIENIPTAVVMLNGELKAVYINKIARTLAGEAYIGKTCFELFARDDFGSPTDALKKAVDSKSPATAETRAHPQGRDMDISYTAIPMQNAQKQTTAVMQTITDLTEIKTRQNTMVRVAGESLEISNRVAAASEELSAQVEQVSRGAEMQRSHVESTASAMTEMNSTVLEVARSAGQASEQSEQTRNKADDGAELVNKVVQSIRSVNHVTTSLHTSMQELGAQAESVSGVMNIISDIADQTNLLALNAAIEAARAGEAGRGFAVVADEVRKLAEKTMQATHEVGSNISAIQNSTRQNIESVADAVKAANEAEELANSSGEALTEIVHLASASSALVASIATAAEEQSATSEEINRAIGEISQVVGETSDGMIQASSAVQELSHMAQELNRVMEDLK